jgi:hypothetical protein
VKSAFTVLPDAVKAKVYEMASTALFGPFKFIADVVCSIYSLVSPENQQQLIDKVIIPIKDLVLTKLNVVVDRETIEIYLDLCKSKQCDFCQSLDVDSVNDVAAELIEHTGGVIISIQAITQSDEYNQVFAEIRSLIDETRNMKPTELITPAKINELYGKFSSLRAASNEVENKIKTDPHFSKIIELQNNLSQTSKQVGGKKPRRRRTRTIRKKRRKYTPRRK